MTRVIEIQRLDENTWVSLGEFNKRYRIDKGKFYRLYCETSDDSFSRVFRADEDGWMKPTEEK